MEQAIYSPVFCDVQSIELAKYWSVLSTVSSMEVDIYRPVLCKVPT